MSVFGGQELGAGVGISVAGVGGCGGDAPCGARGGCGGEQEIGGFGEGAFCYVDGDKAAVNGDGNGTEVEVVEEYGTVVVDADMFCEIDLEGAARDDGVVKAEFQVEKVFNTVELLEKAVRGVVFVKLEMDTEEDKVLEVNFFVAEEDAEGARASRVGGGDRGGGLEGGGGGWRGRGVVVVGGEGGA